MKAEILNSFLMSFVKTLEQLGVKDIKKSSVNKKEVMDIDKEVTTMIGIIGDVRGNVSYSMDVNTAKNLVSAMMMGMTVENLDEMARSGLAEMTNMITGNASMTLESKKINSEVTPPSVVTGKNIYFILSTVETISVEMSTSAGLIEVNLAIE